MLARKQEINLQLNQLTDALLLGGVFWLSHFLRANQLVILDNLWAIDTFGKFVWMLAVIMPLGPFLLEMQGFYDYPLEKTVWKSLRQMAAATFWLILVLGLAVIFLRLEVPSRSVLILFCLAAPVVLLLRERLSAWSYLSKLKRGEAGERVIVAGEPESIRRMLDSLSPVLRLEIQVAQQIDLQHQTVQNLVDAIHAHSVGRVILAFNRIEIATAQRAIEACETEGVEAWLSADFIQTSVARPAYEKLGRNPMLVFRATPEISWSLLIKDVMDRVGALMGLAVLSPLLLMVALLVKLSSPGPVIFRQRRAGHYGRPFEMLKFRTMYVDAEQRREELLAQNTMSGPVFKADNDPRITPIGRFLRKTSIDELPQFFNVLRGEMSLVGPRPLPLYEVEQFEHPRQRRRLSMKPGLTCIWQIRGRNRVRDFGEWVAMDLEYIDNWSILLDVYILVRTVPAVLFGVGAK